MVGHGPRIQSGSGVYVKAEVNDPSNFREEDEEHGCEWKVRCSRDGRPLPCPRFIASPRELRISGSEMSISLVPKDVISVAARCITTTATPVDITVEPVPDAGAGYPSASYLKHSLGGGAEVPAGRDFVVYLELSTPESQMLGKGGEAIYNWSIEGLAYPLQPGNRPSVAVEKGALRPGYSVQFSLLSNITPYGGVNPLTPDGGGYYGRHSLTLTTLPAPYSDLPPVARTVECPGEVIVVEAPGWVSVGGGALSYSVEGVVAGGPSVKMPLSAIS
eukprot:Hpha_TRINITY_DN11628_c0_g2::TRINITY_DN11628_c0_g2_i2::g.49243::m.49243